MDLAYGVTAVLLGGLLKGSFVAPMNKMPARFLGRNGLHRPKSDFVFSTLARNGLIFRRF